MNLLNRSKSSRSFRQLLAAAAEAVLLVLFFAVNLQSQQSTSHEVKVTLSAADYAAAAEVKNEKIHARPANTPIGRTTSTAAISNSPNVTAPVAPFAAPDPGGLRYPADLSFHGGNVAMSMQSHAMYMNPNGGWGNPEGFLGDLGKSDFIHVVDQYTGSGADNRYTVSDTHFTINYHPSAAAFTDADMLAIVHAVAALTGQSGYGNEYHVFLPPGQDECFGRPITHQQFTV